MVVEDERPLAQLVADYLGRAGFAATQAHSGTDAVELTRTLDPDLILLDLGLPGLDGIEVCRQIRAMTDAYVIMLTARDDEVDKLIGLGVGADDYITKPFSPRELVARVQAALRRPRASTLVAPDGERPVVYDGLSVDLQAREAKVSDTLVALTRTEFDLLAALTKGPRRVFSRRQLVDAVWGADWVGDEHIVDVHIAHLRRKLGDNPTEPRWIETVRGIGYRLTATVDH
ncbi:response regulator transcription factor [Nocardioides sp. 31GB23]|uniref:response regulator transcription factor n=1 Tax=Nocardioides sp. 31GB23 TaxID=3156065 RepID=UPI0032AFC1EF